MSSPKRFSKAYHSTTLEPGHPKTPAKKTPLLRKIKKLFLFTTAFLTSAAVFIWYSWDSPLLSPLSQSTTFRFFYHLVIPKEPDRPKKIVYGFVPYWNLTEVTVQDELTHLAYFGLTVGQDGRIITTLDDGPEPGYRGLQSDALLELTQITHERNIKLELVLKQFNAEDIEVFLTSPAAQEQFFQSLDAILLAYPVSGINLDFEHPGSVDATTRQGFTRLVKRLRAHLETKYKGVKLSVDMYGGAAKSQQLWDVPAIAREVDYIIIMAYDYHRTSSPQAGPVAPLFGGSEQWDSDISDNLRAFLAVAPREKLILGIPFYGYQWQTTSREAQAHTYPDTGSAISIHKVNELIRNKQVLGVTEQWNETALSPYLSYVKDEQNHIVYYENPRSLAYKLEFANELDLAGIAIWALGYEADSRELWDVIQREL